MPAIHSKRRNNPPLPVSFKWSGTPIELMERRRLFSSTLPDLVHAIPSSNPALPSGMDTFSPPVQVQTLASGVPTIGTSGNTASSGDTISLTGSAFTDDAATDFADTKFLIYGQTSASNGLLEPAQLQSTTTYGALATIPSSEPSDSMYLVWPENNSGIGSPVAVNQTHTQWLSSPTAVPSSTVSVYGRNLTNGSGQSWVYLQPTSGTGQWATVTNANPYRVQFTMPATAVAGVNYQVWVNNGLGGNDGWSTPLSLTVAPVQTWSGTINVKNYGATGNGTTDDGPAILNAIDALQPNETLYFPTGTYIVNSEQIILPSNVRVLGDSQTSSVITFDGSVPDTGWGQFEIGVPDSYNSTNIDFESIGLTYNGTSDKSTSSPALVRERYASDMTFNNVALTSNAITAIDWERSRQVTLTNSTIISNEIYVNGCTDADFDHDVILQAFDAYGQAGISFDSALNVNITNCTTENYYDYELSVNPDQPYDLNGYGEGRFLEFGPSWNVYVASNQTINLGESSSPADRNSGEQINVEGSDDVVYLPVASATSNTFTLAGSDATTVVGDEAIITSGAAVNQEFTISAALYSASTNTTTYTLNGDFTVIPAAGSNIDIADAPSNFVFYQNTLNHTTGAYASQDVASTGFEFFTGGSGIVMDGNTVNNTRSGIKLSSSNVHVPISSIDIVNNTFNGVQLGIGLASGSGTDPDFVAIAMRNNSVNGASASYNAATAAVDVVNTNQSSADTLTVIDNNTITGFPMEIVDANDQTMFASDNSYTPTSTSASASSNASSGTVSTASATASNASTGMVSPASVATSNASSGTLRTTSPVTSTSTASTTPADTAPVKTAPVLTTTPVKLKVHSLSRRSIKFWYYSR